MTEEQIAHGPVQHLQEVVQTKQEEQEPLYHTSKGIPDNGEMLKEKERHLLILIYYISPAKFSIWNLVVGLNVEVSNREISKTTNRETVYWAIKAFKDYYKPPSSYGHILLLPLHWCWSGI